LQCEILGAFPKPLLQWTDSSGNILPAAEPQVSERGGSYDVILQTTVTKTDSYSCVASQEEIYHQTKPAHIYASLSGAASEPSVTSIKQTKDWSLLQCLVRGAFPKPKVEWQDSSGNILPAEKPQVSERGGSFYITLNANVTKTDHYQCVVTQEEIYHENRAEISVYISDSGSPIGWIVLSAVLGIIVVVGGVVVYKGYIKLNHLNNEMENLKKNEERNTPAADSSAGPMISDHTVP
ncbi:selection and upkeep of intraepithelial T-cells protein 3-like, partial [Trematomus bernacchii]|uniref:selection and upkeep of intraepithelial T-cells protein 3-like n=1 Tax=Trematomus bernacchii TaxID=40690 RepID=UPI00146AF107